MKDSLNKKNFIPETPYKLGIASLLVIMLVLVGGLSIVLAFSFLILNELKTNRAFLNSNKAFYASESGIEDALVRLRPGGALIVGSYGLTIDDSSATITISSLIGGSRTITSDGVNKIQKKRNEVLTKLAVTSVGFYFGAQVGEGGLEMGSNARINGNVFSNGDIVGSNGATASGTAKVAGNGHSISNMIINSDAFAYSFNNCSVGGVIHYVTGGSVTSCSSGGGVQEQSDEIASVVLPVSSSTINMWKQAAEAGGTMGSLVLGNNVLMNKGPMKIDGNLQLGNGSTLTMTGTLWVTGDLIMGNNSVIKLDPSYGSLSGVIIFDGKVAVKNNGQLYGIDPNATSTFLMVISENSSIDPASPAIDIYNSAGGAVFYTNTGMILIHNAVEVFEATGYKLMIDNNGSIDYKTGLSDVSFTSGPSAGSVIFSWQEIP